LQKALSEKPDHAGCDPVNCAAMLAKKMGADYVINVEKEDIRERIAELNGLSPDAVIRPGQCLALRPTGGRGAEDTEKSKGFLDEITGLTGLRTE